MASMSYQDFIKHIEDWDSFIDINDTEMMNMIYQINHDNYTDFTVDDVELSKPIETKVIVVPLDHPNTPIELNTKVIVSSKPGSKFRGSDSYLYRRIDIETQWKILYGDKPFKLPHDNMSDDEIKTFLLKKMPFLKSSIVVKRVNDTITNEEYVHLVPIPDSYLYIGELKLYIHRDDGPIAKIKKMNDMQGLNYPVNDIFKLHGLNYPVISKIDLQGLNYPVSI